MFKALKLYIVVLICIFSGVALAQYSPTNPAPLKQWTFMVYIDGDNNLEGDALDDFLEMASVGSGSDFNIVVMLDRVDGESSDYDNWTDTRLGLISYGDSPTSSWGESLGEINMGNPDSLYDFMSWAGQSYPSNQTMLILWNHGGGWQEYYASVSADSYLTRTGSLPVTKTHSLEKAICLDDTSEDELTLPEIRGVLDDINTDLAISVDILGMDACLMGMVEVAYEFGGQVDYVVSSPATEPLSGWAYDTTFNDFILNPYMSCFELGNIIVNRYYESVGSSGTLSVVDMAYIDSLESSIDSFAESLNSWLDDPGSCAAAALGLQDVFEQVVVAERHGVTHDSSHGMSINFPDTGSQSAYSGNSMRFVQDSSWSDFLDFYAAQDTEGWLYKARQQTHRLDDDSSYCYYDLYDFADKVLSLVPVGLEVIPGSSMIVYAGTSGQLSFESKVYQLTNVGETEVGWSASTDVSWLTISQPEGTLASGQTASVGVEVDKDVLAAMSEGQYSGKIIFTDSQYNKRVTIAAELLIGEIDPLTEYFEGSGVDDFDLANKTITFVPDSSGLAYSACVQDTAVTEFDTSGATVLQINDDDSVLVSVAGDYLSLYGVSYDKVYVGSNGYLTFSAADTTYEESIVRHYLLPRISGFFYDLNPEAGAAEISYEVGDDRLIVTYKDVPTIGSLSDTVSFQVQMLYNSGVIKIIWLDVNSNIAVVGLSDGSKTNDITESNFSDYSLCQEFSEVPVAISSSFIVYNGLQSGILLRAYDDGLPAELEYVVDILPQYGNIYYNNQEVVDVPFSMGTDNYLLYIPYPGADGVDGFTWHVSDSLNMSDPAMVTIELYAGTNYFTEKYLPGMSDLSGLSVTFTPDGSDSYYSACINQISSLPNATDEATSVFNASMDNDERTTIVSMQDSKTVSLYGQQWSGFYVCSNGYITFGSNPLKYKFTLANHFNVPGISLFFTDLNPSDGDGSVTYQQLDDKMVVTFENVQEFGSDEAHTFQVEMFFDGAIRISWLDVENNGADAGVGLSAGPGSVPDDFYEYDFSRLGNYCDDQIPVAEDSQEDIWAGQSMTVVLSAEFASGYEIDTLPAEGTLFDGVQAIESVPYDLADNSVLLYAADRSAGSVDSFSWHAYSSGGQVSNTATVSIDIYQCDSFTGLEVENPVDGEVAYPLNYPLMWNVNTAEYRTKASYLQRSAGVKSVILTKDSADSAQDGEPTIGNIDLLEFVNSEHGVTNILVYSGYSDNNSGGEVENTLNAIAEYYPDFVVTMTDTEDPCALSQQLADAEVFLVPEQELITAAKSIQLATAFSSVLKSYVERGGALLVCDFNWNGGEFLTTAGFMNIGTPSVVSDSSLIVNPDGLLNVGLQSTFTSMPGTLSYTSTDGLVLVETDGGAPVVSMKVSGDGFVVLFGWDYYSYGDDMAMLIANAVKYGAKQYYFDIYLDTVNPPANKVAQGYQYDIYDPGVLDGSQTYYWYVEASNKCGDIITGPVWQFQTTSSVADYNGDMAVNILDMASLAEMWLEDTCSHSWFNCDGVDSDRSGDVSISDLQEFVKNWLN